jgi:hypothetical protein
VGASARSDAWRPWRPALSAPPSALRAEPPRRRRLPRASAARRLRPPAPPPTHLLLADDGGDLIGAGLCAREHDGLAAGAINAQRVRERLRLAALGDLERSGGWRGGRGEGAFRGRRGSWGAGCAGDCLARLDRSGQPPMEAPMAPPRQRSPSKPQSHYPGASRARRCPRRPRCGAQPLAPLLIRHAHAQDAQTSFPHLARGRNPSRPRSSAALPRCPPASHRHDHQRDGVGQLAGVLSTHQVQQLGVLLEAARSLAGRGRGPRRAGASCQRAGSARWARGSRARGPHRRLPRLTRSACETAPAAARPQNGAAAGASASSPRPSPNPAARRRRRRPAAPCAPKAAASR